MGPSPVADGPARGRWTGVDGMSEGLRSFLSVWEGFGIEGEQYRELDDERVLVLTRYTGRGKASGPDVRQMRAKGAGLFHVRNGKVTRLVAYMDGERALADLGLPSEAGSPRS
jgi:hypothetical protein